MCLCVCISAAVEERAIVRALYMCSIVNNIMITGNELIHQLTNDGRIYALRVDLTNYTGHSIYAKYNNFSVGPESDNYMLHVSGYDTGSSAGNYH